MTHTCETCHAPLEPNAIRCPVCHAPAVAAGAGGKDPPTALPELVAGTVFDQKYVILDHLGRGGFGDVFRVLHTMLQREFALKMLHADLAIDRGLRERFFREARVLLDLTHPNIVTVRDVGQYRGILYMVMDLCPGETLESMLAREGRLPGAEVAQLGMAILNALEVAHRKGVIHRDLKPANVMISRKGGEKRSVQILDFGIAKMLDGSTNEEGTLTGNMLIGTPQYMSPEQAQGESLDGRSDLYSLAVILYHAATGKRPFGGSRGMDIIRHMLKDPVPPFSHWGVTEDPKGIEAVLMKALEKDPLNRPASAADMRRMLEAVLPGYSSAKSVTARCRAPRLTVDASSLPGRKSETTHRPFVAPAPVEAAVEARTSANAPVAIASPAPPEPAPAPPKPVWTLPTPDDAHIVFYCSCGCEMVVRDAHAGHSGMCPHCWRAVRVPTPSRIAPRQTVRFRPCRRCGMEVESFETENARAALCATCAAGHRSMMYEPVRSDCTHKVRGGSAA